MSGLADEAYWAKTKKTKIHHLSWLSSIPFLPHLSTCHLSSPAAHQWGEAWRPMGPSAGGGSAGWRTAMEEREGKGGGSGVHGGIGEEERGEIPVQRQRLSAMATSHSGEGWGLHRRRRRRPLCVSHGHGSRAGAPMAGRSGSSRARSGMFGYSCRRSQRHLGLHGRRWRLHCWAWVVVRQEGVWIGKNHKIVSFPSSATTPTHKISAS